MKRQELCKNIQVIEPQKLIINWTCRVKNGEDLDYQVIIKPKNKIENTEVKVLVKIKSKLSLRKNICCP